MHEPINPHSTFKGHPFSFATVLISKTGVAKSGVKGPLIWGVRVSKSISIISSK